MPPFHQPQEPVRDRDEGVAETLRHVEILGRLILRTIHRLEKQMADRNYTTQEILEQVRAQRSEIASMSLMMGSIKSRLNAALAGEISPKGQAILNDIMSEMQGNSRAMANAVRNNDEDPSNDVDENGNPINQGAPATGGATTTGGTTEPADTDKASTTTTLSTTKAVANIGEEITLSASVSAASGTDKAITGMVTFATEGGAIGRASLDSTGVAAMSTTVPAGDHSITATYGGDDNFASSTSDAITQSALAPDQPQGEAPTGAQVDPSTQAQPGGTAPAPETPAAPAA